MAVALLPAPNPDWKSPYYCLQPAQTATPPPARLHRWSYTPPGCRARSKLSLHVTAPAPDRSSQSPSATHLRKVLQSVFFPEVACPRKLWPFDPYENPRTLIRLYPFRKNLKEVTMSSSSGYVSIPHYLVIFDGVNYTDFIAYMHIHMRGRLWCVLSGEVFCPQCPVSLVDPTPPAPAALAPVFPRLIRMRKKFIECGVVAIYNVSNYQMALDSYRHELATYARWFDEDAHSAAMSLSCLNFPRSLWDYLQPSRCELTFATTI